MPVLRQASFADFKQNSKPLLWMLFFENVVQNSAEELYKFKGDIVQYKTPPLYLHIDRLSLFPSIYLSMIPMNKS